MQWKCNIIANLSATLKDLEVVIVFDLQVTFAFKIQKLLLHNCCSTNKSLKFMNEIFECIINMKLN